MSSENIFNRTNHIREIELIVVLGEASDSAVRMLFFWDWPNFCKSHTLFYYN